ncbi:hypothetical protein VP14_200 [Vibrio phage VPMCC14]|nr:hypothetical protein VP14_200 [Vibrio phage VPMCC14]
MNLDTVNVVAKVEVSHKDGEQVTNVTYLKEFIYYGTGGANDAQKCLDKSNELNASHKSPSRYYMAVRLHISEAMKFGLFDEGEE